MLGRIMKLGFIPTSIDAGLLFLRVSICLNLFIRHGYEKAFTFSQMEPTFMGLLNLGATNTLIIAMIGDSICSLLVVFGVATRWAALYCFCNIFVAWTVKAHFQYFGYRVDHGELMVLYLVALIAIIITGPGRYSVDSLIKD